MSDQTTQISSHYDSFFAGVEYAAVGFCSVEIVSAWLYSSPGLWMAAATTGTLGLLFAVARALLRTRRLVGAILVASAAASLAALFYMISLPELVAGFALFPVATIGMAMLVQSRRLFLGAATMAVVTEFLIIGLAFLPRQLPPIPAQVSILLQFATPVTVMILVSLLLGYTWNNLNTTLQASQASNRELATLRDSLEEQVAQRTGELQGALSEVQVQSQHQARLLLEIERQQATIRELGVPVLPVSASAVVVPLVGALDGTRLDMLRERALHAIEQRKARTLLLDLTGVEMLDERMASGMLELSNAARLLGASVVMIGIRPEVAESIVALGTDLRGMRSMRDLQTALAEFGGSA